MSNSQIEAQAPWRDEEVFEALGLDAERYRTECGAINRVKLRATILHPADYLSSDHWLNTRAALPAPADQPPSQEPQGSSGSLSESGAEAGARDAAPEFHRESKPCPECGATMLYDEGEPWDGASWGCTGCGHSENAR